MWLSCRVDASIERFHTICRGHQWLRVTAAIPMKLVNASETVARPIQFTHNMALQDFA